VKTILEGHEREVAEWIADRCPHLELVTPYTAIGLVSGGELIAGVMYDNYTRIGIEMHARVDKGALTRLFVSEAFGYPFLQLNVRRVGARVPATNAASRGLVEHLGFVLEGTIRQILKGGEDLIIYGMLESECRWLETYGISRRTGSTRTLAAERAWCV
jgi:RimJ/RimL family protein N-acetyltransferase